MNSTYDSLQTWFNLPLDRSDPEQFGRAFNSCREDLNPVWHPLGFIHARLSTGPDGDTFRMHVWSSAHHHAMEQEDKVHDHLFDVTSRVLFGAIEDARYEFEPNPEGRFRDLRVDYRPAHRSLKEVNSFGDLVSTSTAVHSSSSEYKIPAYQLHETTLHSAPLALTIAHTTNPTQYEPRAIFKRQTEIPPRRTPIPCDRELWLSLVKHMLRL